MKRVKNRKQREVRFLQTLFFSFHRSRLRLIYNFCSFSVFLNVDTVFALAFLPFGERVIMRGREVSQNSRLSSVVNEQDQEHAIESSQTQVQHFAGVRSQEFFFERIEPFILFLFFF